MDRKINFKKLYGGVYTPTKSNTTDAGYDLYSVNDVAIPKGYNALINTGIAIEIPKGFVGLIWDRSSLGVKGIHRHAGVIDCGYTGEVKVCLHNNSAVTYDIKKGDRIAQLIIHEAPHYELNEVQELGETDRSVGGFGSTGR